MNYLAHAYLSFEHPEILVGNMISDFVKGKKKFDYSTGIQSGIALHREIDLFTDQHPVLKNVKEIFRPDYRLYSSPIIDVLLDHFLATDENEFTEITLEQFTKKTFHTLSQYDQLFPERFKIMFPYMKSQNWLYHYRFHSGIEKSLVGLVRRAKYMKESESAYSLFLENYTTLLGAYREFFPSVKKLALNFLDDKIKTN